MNRLPQHPRAHDVPNTLNDILMDDFEFLSAGQNTLSNTRGVAPEVKTPAPSSPLYVWDTGWLTPSANDPFEPQYGTISTGAPDWRLDFHGRALWSA